ncbi:helix-turn-helix transcriptional regulator [Paenibacillus sp. 598K]|uniref:helix-turn-helix transcriptional regulator n=1 Tax=Paenibacillus sp. 598K TaxID=1117987 RepID=UPI000FFF1021|nr:YafY family protein [Paenibacillus sp. 598K]
MKLERLLAMIYKLLNHEVLSAATLAEEFQVSQRTIYRDIDTISAAGFPVVSHQGQKGGYGMMEGYKLDRSLLGSYDVDNLITVLEGLASVFEDERTQGTIERLRALDPQHANPRLAVDLETRRIAPDALQQLRKAMMDGIVVRFDYVDAHNARTTREIEPAQLLFKFGAWYVQGWCLTREAHREFRLSRMLELTLTGRRFAPGRELPADERLTGERPAAGDGLVAGAGQDELQEVVLLVEPESLSEALDQFQWADKEQHADGSMTLRISVHQPEQARWLHGLLLGLGRGAEVLEPPELRTVLKRQLQHMLARYEEV